MEDEATYGAMNQVITRFDNLVEKIIEERIYHSKAALYAALDINTGKMSRLRKGTTDIDYKVLYHLKSNVKQVNLNWLFTGEGDALISDQEQTYSTGVTDVLTQLAKSPAIPPADPVLSAILDNQRAIKLLIQEKLT